ncbi:MAG: type I-B CRISPR-associated protein Cas5b [candidate division WOR-3 bacterium]
MDLLRLKIYQPHAHYRIPFTFARRHTYPIPPYSTVIGLICNVLGIKDQADENFRRLKENLYLAIYGKFESMTREYIWLRNLNKESHISRFGSAENRIINHIPEHPGGQMPTRIDVLENVNLIIYIHSEGNFLNTLCEAFKNPEKRIYPFHLGRSEDWIVFDGNQEEAIKLVEIDESKKEPFYGKFDYYTWIPDPVRAEKYINKNLYCENFDKFYTKLKGSSHLITSFYEIKDGFRNFIHIPVKLFEQGDFPFYFGEPYKFLKDTELDIPLFLCKLNGG